MYMEPRMRTGAKANRYGTLAPPGSMRNLYMGKPSMFDSEQRKSGHMETRMTLPRNRPMI